jgi:capsular exopolysaccharide synthesis family protein
MNKNNTTPRENGFMAQRRNLLSDISSFTTAEAYRTLRTNIRFALRGEGCKKFCITSSAQGEGKSITITNLAISFAEAGHKVLLIDADLRRPAVARLLVEKATPGLSNVLAGLSSEEEAVRPSAYTNLDILLSGDVPPNPAELLGSERMLQLMEKLSKKYDYILVDTPPVNIVSDTAVVANMLDGVLLLARQDRSRKDNIKRAVNNLKLTGAKILGCVFNGVPRETKGYYYEYKEQ